MPMDADILAAELKKMEPTGDDVIAAQRFADAFDTYFADAVAGAVTANPAGRELCKEAMAAVLTGMSIPNASAAVMTAGVSAYWAAVLPSLVFTGATAITPPPGLTNLGADLATKFFDNLGASLSDAMNAVAELMHDANADGIATIGGTGVTII
jgi:hypothetical protein